jgi:nitrate reductase alpha subunit
LNGRVLDETVAKGRPIIETDINACETILMLAPETNGEVAVRAWEALEKQTGREHTHLARPKEDEKIRFRDHCCAAAQDHHLSDLVRDRERACQL